MTLDDLPLEPSPPIDFIYQGRDCEVCECPLPGPPHRSRIALCRRCIEDAGDSMANAVADAIAHQKED